MCMGRQVISLSQCCLAHGQGRWHNLTLSIIYLEAPLSCREVLPNTESFDIKEWVVDKAIGPLAVDRRQVNYLFSLQGTLELKDRGGVKKKRAINPEVLLIKTGKFKCFFHLHTGWIFFKKAQIKKSGRYKGTHSSPNKENKIKCFWRSRSISD